MNRRFLEALLLAASLIMGFGVARSNAAVATDPQARSLSPEQQLQQARWQAEQSEVEKMKVGRERAEHQAAQKRDIVAGLQSQLAKRMELINPVPRPQSGVSGGSAGQSSMALWLLSIGCVGFAFLYFRRPAFLEDLLSSLRDPCAPSEGLMPENAGGQPFSEFAAQFAKGTWSLAGSTIPVPTVHSEESGSLKHESAPETAAEEDTDPLRAFWSGVSEDLATIRKLISKFAEETSETAQPALIVELLRPIRSLKGKSGVPELLHIWQLTYALERLLDQLVRKSSSATLSAMRTVATAVDLLHALCVPGSKTNMLCEPPVRLLAVDDDAISRHAVTLALSKVLTPPDLACDGKAGLALAQKQHYDAIFLDVEMPGMDGFELCSLIHGTALNQTTPVVFVTSHSSFSDRTKCSLIGGQDLIGKPFLTFELALKALTIVLRHRLQSQPGACATLSVAPAYVPLSGHEARQELAELRPA
jgi:CheY-like chemotaxis protein